MLRSRLSYLCCCALQLSADLSQQQKDASETSSVNEKAVGAIRYRPEMIEERLGLGSPDNNTRKSVSIKGGIGTSLKFRLGTERSTPQNFEAHGGGRRGAHAQHVGDGFKATKMDYRNRGGNNDGGVDSSAWGWRMWVIPKFNDRGGLNALRSESAQERLEHIQALNRPESGGGFTLEQDKAIVEYANEFCWNHNAGSQVWFLSSVLFDILHI